VSERRAASRTTQIRRSISSIGGFPLLDILLTYFLLLDSFTLIGAIGILNGTVSGVFRSPGSPDHGDLPVIPLPWYPTASQAIPDWRRFQGSSLFLIRAHPRQSAVKSCLPAYPFLIRVHQCRILPSAINGSRAITGSPDLQEAPPPIPSISIPKHLPRIIPRASQAAADWPQTGLSYCNETAYVSKTGHESQAKSALSRVNIPYLLSTTRSRSDLPLRGSSQTPRPT
jgi:hypothetical protein